MWGGCSSSASNRGTSGQDATEAQTCKGQILLVKEQKSVDMAAFANDPLHPERKNDPVIQKLLGAAAACPDTYQDMEALAALKACTLSTRIISERTALNHGAPDVGRALVSRDCGGAPSLFFLLDPINTTPKSVVPTQVEIIGNNSTDGIFSYYAREQGDSDASAMWKYYGTSVDFVSNGYDCDPSKFSGACQSKLAQDKGVPGAASGVRCASCHPGGGLVQKELNSPWTNWQVNPASGSYLTDNQAVLGSFQNGDLFEGVTTPLNKAWAAKRVKLFQDHGTVKDLLRPVFCTMDVNLQAGGTQVRADLLLDLAFVNPASFFMGGDAFGGIGSTGISSLGSNYGDVIKANGQKINTTSFTDTADPFMYPERSQLDHQYVAALSQIVGQDLLVDILFVDFTRPIFSPTRCGLVDLADGLKNPATAKADLVAKLTAGTKSDAEKELLASLKDPTGTGGARHAAAIATYRAACAARAKDPKFTDEVVKYASHLRRVARLPRVQIALEKTKDVNDNPDGDFGVIDFEETLPRDNLDNGPLTQPAFDKTTCVLKE